MPDIFFSSAIHKRMSLFIKTCLILFNIHRILSMLMVLNVFNGIFCQTTSIADVGTWINEPLDRMLRRKDQMTSSNIFPCLPPGVLSPNNSPHHSPSFSQNWIKKWGNITPISSSKPGNRPPETSDSSPELKKNNLMISLLLNRQFAIIAPQNTTIGNKAHLSQGFATTCS